MELLNLVTFILVASIFCEGCHYGYGKRKKRDAETEVELSSDLRSFFVECLNNLTLTGYISGYDHEFWQTTTDVTVLDTAWYDTTASTQCVEGETTDNPDCWIDAITYYLSDTSNLIPAVNQCIRDYFAQLNLSTSTPARKKRQLFSSTIQRATGYFTRWTSWSTCTRTCGTGRQIRSRTCMGSGCRGETVQSRNCATPPCRKRGSCFLFQDELTYCRRIVQSCKVARWLLFMQTNCRRTCCEAGSSVGPPGFWGRWSAWSTCSESCGLGYSHRTRTCFGGQCEGIAREVRRCYVQKCKRGEWGSWGSWSRCSNTCDFGYKHRRRRCEPHQTVCYGYGTETQSCFLRSCRPFPRPNTDVKICIRRSSNSSLSPNRAPINYTDLNSFLKNSVRCKLWTSLRILQYSNNTDLVRPKPNVETTAPTTTRPVPFEGLAGSFSFSRNFSTSLSRAVSPEANNSSIRERFFLFPPFVLRPTPTTPSPTPGRYFVPRKVIEAAARENIPEYLLNADEEVPLPPSLLNVAPSSHYYRQEETTVCLASITKSFSPLREVVESCAASFSRRDK